MEEWAAEKQFLPRRRRSRSRSQHQSQSRRLCQSHQECQSSRQRPRRVYCRTALHYRCSHCQSQCLHLNRIRQTQFHRLLRCRHQRGFRQKCHQFQSPHDSDFRKASSTDFGCLLQILVEIVSNVNHKYSQTGRVQRKDKEKRIREAEFLWPIGIDCCPERYQKPVWNLWRIQSAVQGVQVKITA